MHHLIALLFTLTCLGLPAKAQPVTVFAAASLRDALTEIARGYDGEVTLSFGGSGTLARQVAAGAPADAVVLAHPDWTAWLDKQGVILPDTLRDVAGGQLVLVGAAGASALTAPDATTLTQALNGGRLAMGQRDGVPAGTYAREWLHRIGAWDTMEPQLAETDNVRAALALVAQGAAPLGVVYASDAVSEPRVSVRYAIPSDAHSPIRYPAAALTPAGIDFVDYLNTPAAAEVFARYGFAP